MNSLSKKHEYGLGSPPFGTNMQLQNEFHLQPSARNLHWTRDVTLYHDKRRWGNRLKLDESRCNWDDILWVKSISNFLQCIRLCFRYLHQDPVRQDCTWATTRQPPALTILYMYWTGWTEMPQSHTWQPPSMYHQNPIRGWRENFLRQERTHDE